MLVSDSVFEKIGKYYKLNDYELDTFVEDTRNNQIEIFYKSFLMYFEDHKSELEMKYIEKIAENKDSREGFKKLHRLIVNEMDNNLEARRIIMSDVHGYVMHLIHGFLKRCDDEEVIKEVLNEFFFYLDPVKAGIEAGDISPESLTKVWRQ
jgi:hypothetical protein